MTEFRLRLATEADAGLAWEFIQDSIAARKRDGSAQWQNGYPNEQTVASDIDNGYGYMLEQDGVPVAYAAIIFDVEPAYNELEGTWLTDGEYVVIHRVARSAKSQTKGIAAQVLKLTEQLCRQKGIPSIRLDTNFDNLAMLRTLDKLEYSYCGEVQYQGAPRKAFEKVISSGP